MENHKGILLVLKLDLAAEKVEMCPSENHHNFIETSQWCLGVRVRRKNLLNFFSKLNDLYRPICCDLNWQQKVPVRQSTRSNFSSINSTPLNFMKNWERNLPNKSILCVRRQFFVYGFNWSIICKQMFQNIGFHNMKDVISSSVSM